MTISIIASPQNDEVLDCRKILINMLNYEMKFTSE